MRSFIDKGYGWPLFVVILLVSSVAMMGIVVMAARSDGGAQVVDDYYQQAVSWDSLAQVRNAASVLGWDADLSLDHTDDGLEGRITLMDSTGHAVSGHHATVRLRRPQLAAVVGEIQASETAISGTYVFDSEAMGSGLWDVEVIFHSSAEPALAVSFDWRREVR